MTHGRSPSRAQDELHSKVDLVRRYALRDLAKAGGAEVIAHIRPLLRDRKTEIRREARAALKEIAAREGLELADEDESPPAEGYVERKRILDLSDERFVRDELVQEAFIGTDLHIESRPYGHEVVATLIDGRKQTVQIVFENRDLDGDPIILVFSVCGPASRKNYRWALQQNRKLHYARLAIRRQPEGEVFILMNTLLEETADPPELRKTILYIAEKADMIEQALSEDDRY